ncbi:hypothetical protein [Aquabacterium sp.]|uniref:hypothetical protein n=1 Tax=Aquabacterium sp. TaxID=1872578 RepID=UPI0035B36993
MTTQRQHKHRLSLKLAKPRNPLVAPTSQRKAGSHQKSMRRERQAARREIATALKER